MYLSIKTDQPTATICLVDNDTILLSDTWEAGRQLAETIQPRIHSMLQQGHKTPQDLTGIIVYAGPGSFTGLRIGISVANALSYSLGIPICGSGGEDWLAKGARILRDAPSMQPIVPNYGAPVHITAPRK